jgi:type II secretory pathway pseudopilin PulG
MERESILMKDNKNKNKKAFTLIELLAIIVILAIIAVITVPVMLNVIENAKKGAAIDSAYGYKDAVYKSFLAELSDDTTKVLPEGTYSLNNAGKLVRNNPLSELNVNVSGTTPSDGWMEFTKGEAKAYSLRFGDYVVTKYSDTKAEAVKNGEIAENAVDRENRLETERQTNAITTAKNAILSETGTTEIRDITDGWVAFIDGSLKAYSIRVTEGEYTYIVTDLDVNSDNSNADASRVTTDLASKTSTEQLIINYYSDQVATEVGTYIASLATETQGFTKDEGKKVSELTTAVPTGMDGDSWIFYDNTSSSITDYSIKMTKGGYVFVVNCTAGTVSDPVYNGTITTPQKKPASFADDSWSDIVTNLSTNRNFYPLGSTKIISFDRDGDSTNEYYKLRLVNTSPCSSSTATSKTSCGVVIEFVTLIGTHNMNATANGTTTLGDGNVGGWKETAMRRYLNTDTGNIYSKLPSDLQNVIIGTAPIVSGSGSGGVSDDVVVIEDAEHPENNFYGDKLYLLSGREVGFDLSYDNKRAATDTNILKYYEENNSNNSRKKYSTTTSAGVDSSAAWYWLRSAYSSNANSFYRVNDDGTNGNSYARNGGGVAPAFRILD